MALEFVNVEAKTGEALTGMSNKVVDHSYLEQLLGDRVGDPALKLAVTKLYEGVNPRDLQRLKEQGLHLVLSNGRTGYLADERTALLLKEKVFASTFSDAVAYGSVPVSQAASSTVRKTTKVFVVDDEAPIDQPGLRWGTSPVVDGSGNEVDEAQLATIADRLGDGYTLIAPSLHQQLSRESAVGAAHTLVDERKLAIAQVHSLSAQVLEGQPLESVVTAQVQEALERSLVTAGGESSVQLQGLGLRTTQDPIRGQVSIAQWRYHDQASNQVYVGKAMLEQSPDGRVALTMTGGTPAQKQEAYKAFDKIEASDLTPFQYRAGVPQWQGVIKGTSRASDLCRQLGVDAIVPKSAIKGDGKTVPLGISEVDSLYWARKTDAASRQQQLGTQVLVNFRAGTEADVLPKLDARVRQLEAAMQDPRKIADLYIQSYERRQQYLGTDLEAEIGGAEAEDGEFSKPKPQQDWLYELLKQDARVTELAVGVDPQRFLEAYRETATGQAITLEDWQNREPQLFGALDALNVGIEEQRPEMGAFRQQAADALGLGLDRSLSEALTSATTTEHQGGYAQLLEQGKVVERLYEFMQGEWKSAALGGVSVPAATAQPHKGLAKGEVHFPDLPHGAKVAVYRAPVANVSQFGVMTNNLEAIAGIDPESAAQRGVIYLNPEDAKDLVIDFDGDAPAIIPEQEHVRARALKIPKDVRLEAGQVYVPSLPNGAAVTLYHGNHVTQCINTPIELPESAPRGRKALYLSPEMIEQTKGQSVSYGYSDGLHGYRALIAEVEALNAPGVKPPAVQKATKIVRDANHPSVAKLSPELQAIAGRFTSIEDAAVDAADNPTGMVANVGMKLQAIRQHYAQIPIEQAAAELGGVGYRLGKLLESDGKTISIPPKDADGYDYGAEIKAITNAARSKSAQQDALQRFDRLLFNVQHRLNDQQLQTAVDTPKSADPVNQGVSEFCRAISNVQEVGWIKQKRDPERYMPSMDIKSGKVYDMRPIENATQDPVGRMIERVNRVYGQEQLDVQKIEAYDALLPQTSNKDHQAIAAQVTKEYSTAIRSAAELEEFAEINQGIQLLISNDALPVEIEVTNLTRFDPKGKSPIWDMIETAKGYSIQIIPNEADRLWGIDPSSKAYQTQGSADKPGTHAYQVVAIIADELGKQKSYSIGTLSSRSEQALKEHQLKSEKPKEYRAIQSGLNHKYPAQRAEAQKELDRLLGRVDLSTKTVGNQVKGAVYSVDAFELRPSRDKEVAQDIRSTAESQLQEFADSIGSEDRLSLMQAFWRLDAQQGSQGKTLAMRLFTPELDEVLKHSALRESQVKGLNYETNQLPDVYWSGQTVPVRVALNADPESPTYGKTIWQVGVQETGAETPETQWKSLGVTADTHYHPPVGTIANATLESIAPTLLLKTKSGVPLELSCNQTGVPLIEVGQAQKFCFEAPNAMGKAEACADVFLVVDGERTPVGKLSKASTALIKEKEAELNRTIFGTTMSIEVMSAQAKLAALTIETGSIEIPRTWSKARPEQSQPVERSNSASMLDRPERQALRGKVTEVKVNGANGANTQTGDNNQKPTVSVASIQQIPSLPQLRLQRRLFEVNSHAIERQIQTHQLPRLKRLGVRCNIVKPTSLF